MEIRPLRATLAVALNLLMACSSAPKNDESVVVPTPRTSWVANGLPVHTKLSATKDSIVYGGVEAKHLYAVALDPATGKERWRQPSDVSARLPGVEQTILTDDDTAYFVLQRTAGNRSLLAVTTATGEEKWRRELWEVAVDPNVWSCGDDLCLVAYVPRAKLWRISKSDGSDVADYAITADRGSGMDVMLGIDEPEKSDAMLLMASRGDVYITHFGRLGETKTWSKPASDFFGPTPVSPDGGWGSRRVSGGWLAWLGPVVDCCTAHDPNNDRFPPGAVASFDDQGILRWVAADRFLCETFQVTEAQPLCDGEARLLGADEGTRPNVVEGRDVMTGAVTWRLDLNGEIDEAHHRRKVLRIDQNRYLIDLASGRVLLDVRHGPKPAPPDSGVGWCRTDFEVESIKSFLRELPYAKTRHTFPCRFGGVPADPPLPIPEFAGVNVAGWGAWVEDGQVHAKRQPD